jgi:predicted O-methyltransferase YrrM
MSASASGGLPRLSGRTTSSTGSARRTGRSRSSYSRRARDRSLRALARAPHLTRRAAEWAASITSRAATATSRLPPRVARFYVSALALAVVRRDRFTLVSALPPEDLEALLALADGAKSVAEIGTGPGWSSIALALAQPDRRVVSFDIETRGAPSYARLVPRSVHDRVRFVIADGRAGGTGAPVVDFVFIDSSHEVDETIGTFEAWRPKLSSAGTIVFHDYGNPAYPGVEQAIAQLGLEGQAHGRLFVWRAPA